MDRLRAMSVFVAVAKAGNLSAAARALGEPLTNISRLLAQLEAHLECTLLDRSTRRMALTDAGSAYLETCKSVLETIEGAERRLAGQADELFGDLAITAPAQFGRIYLVPILAEFLTQFPRINARMLLADRIVDLLEEEVDVALRVGILPDSTLLATRVGALRLVTCASPQYLRRNGTPTAPADLARHDCVAFAGISGGTRWIFKSRKHGRKAVRITSRFSVNTADAAAAAASTHVGVARLLSYQVANEVQAGLLQPILEPFEDTEIPVHLVYRPTRSETPRVRAFVTFAASKLRAVKALQALKAQFCPSP